MRTRAFATADAVINFGSQPAQGGIEFDVVQPMPQRRLKNGLQIGPSGRVKFPAAFADIWPSMRYRHRLAIFTAVLAWFTGPSLARSADGVRLAAKFALIRPEADESTDQPQLTPEASWLRHPGVPTRGATTAADATKRKLLSRMSDKSSATVTPLKRQRPKREVDPPKTRRRQLGW